MIKIIAKKETSIFHKGGNKIMKRQTFTSTKLMYPVFLAILVLLLAGTTRPSSRYTDRIKQ